MRSMLMVIVSVMFVGGLSACAQLKGSLGMYSNTIEAVVAAQVAGVYVVEVKKDGAILFTETWTCTKDVTTGKLTGCHKNP